MNYKYCNCIYLIDSSIIYSLSIGTYVSIGCLYYNKGNRIRTWVPNTDTPLSMELKD